MKERPTSELDKELMDPDLGAYIHKHQALFKEMNISACLAAAYEQKDITKAELARRAGMSEVYLHQVFSGRRKPSRDRLLCICFGLEATLEETQQMLKEVGYAQMYPKIKRDAILIHGILHHTPLGDINDRLFAENEKTLF